MVKLFARKPKTDLALAEYPQALAELVTFGEPAEDTDYAAWADRLADHVPDLVRMVLDDDLNERDEDDPAIWAPVHALKVLGVLGPAEAAGPLTQCMEIDDEWFDHELPQVYAAIGPAAIPVLRDYLHEAAHGTHARLVASECLAAIAEKHAEAYAQVVDLLTAFLDRPESDDSAAEEEVTTSIIYNLSLMGARTAYDAIRRAYAEDRVTPRIVMLEDVEREFGMRSPVDEETPPQVRPAPGVRLDLRCKACDREREHIFPVVYYDLGAVEDKRKREKYDPLVIPQRVVCPKCGAVDQYELGGFGRIAVMASMLAETAERSGELDTELTRLPPDQRIKLIHFTTRWGSMHPLEAIERYQRELARRPKDGSLLLGYGNTLQTLGRFDEAEAQFEQALALDGENIDAWESAAQVAGQRGDIPRAMERWRRVLELALDAPLSADDRQELVDHARLHLEQLSAGQIPEFRPLTMRAPRSVERSFANTPMPDRALSAPKVGRNDPCPCGSGKKHKHCHGRAGAPTL